MLQKELAKRLKARYDTKMDDNKWMEVSSDGIPLCRIKYNGQYFSNADQNLSDEYRSKIADIQDEISTVREYVGLYEHAPQMKAADVSDYRQLAAFGDTVLAATYSEKNGFMFCTWKQNADGDSVFWGDYSPNYEYVKEAFAVRSGLVNKHRLFSENECRCEYFLYFIITMGSVPEKQSTVRPLPIPLTKTIMLPSRPMAQISLNSCMTAITRPFIWNITALHTIMRKTFRVILLPYLTRTEML